MFFQAFKADVGRVLFRYPCNDVAFDPLENGGGELFRNDVFVRPLGLVFVHLCDPPLEAKRKIHSDARIRRLGSHAGGIRVFELDRQEEKSPRYIVVLHEAPNQGKKTDSAPGYRWNVWIEPIPPEERDPASDTTRPINDDVTRRDSRMVKKEPAKGHHDEDEQDDILIHGGILSCPFLISQPEVWQERDSRYIEETMLRPVAPRASARINSEFVPDTDPVSEEAQQKAENCGTIRNESMCCIHMGTELVRYEADGPSDRIYPSSSLCSASHNGPLFT